MDKASKAKLKAAERIVFQQNSAGTRAGHRASLAMMRNPASPRNYRMGKPTIVAMMLNPKLRV